VRHVGAHLDVDVDEATVSHRYTAPVSAVNELSGCQP
jgi:hypothetical protein